MKRVATSTAGILSALILTSLIPQALPCIAAQEAPASVLAGSKKLSASDRKLARAFRKGKSGFHIKCKGRVERKLSDDLIGSRHQRFIVRLDSGQTLLIAHNIDLSRKVRRLRINDRVKIRGEYIWNSQGGLMHYTHRDTNGEGFNGWIKHRGKTYR